MGGIISGTLGSGNITVYVEDGRVEASNGGLDCICLKPQKGGLTIDDGKFLGLFKPGMRRSRGSAFIIFQVQR